VGKLLILAGASIGIVAKRAEIEGAGLIIVCGAGKSRLIESPYISVW